jgi:hypothetical protein
MEEILGVVHANGYVECGPSRREEEPAFLDAGRPCRAGHDLGSAAFDQFRNRANMSPWLSTNMARLRDWFP